MKLLLKNNTAESLYEEIKGLPIYDYHCHLNAEEIYNDRQSKNLTELWLKGDHYKWRLMRNAGIDERLITGDAPDYEKFFAFLSALDGAIGNPLYLWSKFELAFYFDVTLDPISKNAERIWEQVQTYIEKHRFSPSYAINKSNVDTVITTEEIFCDFRYHKLIKQESKVSAKVLPAFRGDRAGNINSATFADDVKRLAAVTDTEISCLDDFKCALKKQLLAFKREGGVACDYAIEGLGACEASDGRVEEQFRLALNGVKVAEPEVYKYAMLKFLLEESYKVGFAAEIHIGAMRNNNTLTFAALGADTGYDSISSEKYLTGLKKLLDEIKSEGILGKTVVFNLNPADNEQITTLLGCFASKESPMQFGAAWWFNDTKLGMVRQMRALSETMRFGSFIGMLTDSRSFISYTRHDFFRRLLCSYIGEQVEAGEFPDDFELLKDIAKNVAYFNAKRFFEE